MTVGNYVRHYSVRFGSDSPRWGWGGPRGVWCAVYGVRFVVWLIRGLGAREPSVRRVCKM